MWTILNKISEEKEQKNIFAEEASELRRDAARDFLRRNQIWMRDVLQKYQRKPGHDCSPKDDHIKQPDVGDCTDFQTIFGECQHLSVVAFTSEKAAEWTFKKLGGLVLDCYVKALQPWKDISRDRALNDYVSEKYQKAFYQHRAGRQNIDFYILPTPAKRSATKGMNLKMKQKIYRHVLFAEGSTT
jgi:hypothetical protein